MKKKFALIARIILGLLLLAAGITGLFGLAEPMQYPEPADKFMTALIDTGYILVIVAVLKVLVGASLIINRFVPLSLVVFAPISINMVLFHGFLDIKSIIPALIICLLNVYLLFQYLESYKPMLKAKMNI